MERGSQVYEEQPVDHDGADATHTEAEASQREKQSISSRGVSVTGISRRSKPVSGQQLQMVRRGPAASKIEDVKQ